MDPFLLAVTPAVGPFSMDCWVVANCPGPHQGKPESMEMPAQTPLGRCSMISDAPHPNGESSPLFIASPSPPGKLLRFWSDAGPRCQALLTTTSYFLRNMCLTFVSPVSNSHPHSLSCSGLLCSLILRGVRRGIRGGHLSASRAAWLWDNRLKLFLEI